MSDVTILSINVDDPEEIPYCPICGSEERWVDCWQCHGDGGFHDCGEDCCPCLDKEEITVDCDVCSGEGGYLECWSLPHSDEQMAEYAKRQPTTGGNP